MTPPPQVIDALDGFVPPLLGALERIGWAQRHLHPPLAERLAAALSPHAATVAGPLRALTEAPWPDDLRFLKDRLAGVGRQTVELIEAFVDASRTQGDLMGLYRAIRRFAPIQEALYPVAPILPAVSQWFLEPGRRGDEDLVARLREAALRDDGVRVGVLHSANERGDRGGFSLYVPETWNGRAAMPLVVALHGGSGHGRDFLWVWLREARARGLLLMAPTSQDRTWSIMGGPDRDADPIREAVAGVAARYPVDRDRILLTGMSDGATYALVVGLREDMPFTHLAPACGVLHPVLLADGRIGRLKDRPVYLVHGALDWMFPVGTAQMMRQVLEVTGARLVYREIEDLSHTYPRDENPRILDWLMSA
jgi:phospholipase/carboxylesterase